MGGLPHVRGGVSIRRACSTVRESSSPRAWGCFSVIMPVGGPSGVFPTCVGVFLYPFTIGFPSSCLPHVRGGVSTFMKPAFEVNGSSPRAWGCFRNRQEKGFERRVFPTCVGVFPKSTRKRFRKTCLPHVRGGVSISTFDDSSVTASSPRAWGCFLKMVILFNFQSVFPTCVGVFLDSRVSKPRPISLPHVRGGVS